MTKRTVARKGGAPAQDHLRPLAEPLQPDRRPDLGRAARDLNQIYNRKGLETAILLGNYIIEHFFGGDLGRLRERGNGYTSFRRLAEHDDLQMSASVLWWSLAVVEQLEVLPEDLAQELPLSHHKLLVPVREVDEKLAFARQAVDQQLTKRQLEEEIRRHRRRNRPGLKRGRKPVPPLIKSLARIQKALAFAMEQAEQTRFDTLPRAQAVGMIEDLDKQIEHARSVLATLRHRL